VSSPEPSFAREVAEVEARSLDLRRELGLRDLVFAQVLIVLGPTGLGTAARAGASHAILWLLAFLLFYLPVGAVVIHLSRRLPLEGGLYQWARLGFGEATAFMVAWNYWLFGILYISSLGLSVATGLSYALGPPAAWMARSTPFILAAGLVVVGFMVAVGIRGLALGKWVHDAGGVVQVLAFALLAGAFVAALVRSAPVDRRVLGLAWPEPSLLTLTLFVKTAVFGLGGFEYVAILAGECRSPGRAIARSVLIAGPLIAALYLLGTGAILAFVHPEEVDLINPVAQSLRATLGLSPVAFYLVPGLVLALLLRDLAQQSCFFTGGARLPMVAGWNHLLPAWLARLHPRHRTPVNSVFLAGSLTLGIGWASLIGAGAQEAYQVLLSATGIFVASPSSRSAIPWSTPPRSGRRPRRRRRAAARSSSPLAVASRDLRRAPAASRARQGPRGCGSARRGSARWPPPAAARGARSPAGRRTGARPRGARGRP
jgi:amino acid transporter